MVSLVRRDITSPVRVASKKPGESASRWSNTARRRSVTTRSPVLIIRVKRKKVATESVTATATAAASAWSSRRGSPLPKPASTTYFRPWPSASTQAAATMSAASAAATRQR